MPELRERILRQCFSRFDDNFANGERANNKLDGELIDADIVLRGVVGRLIADNVRSHNPRFVVAVPKGANWIAREVSSRLHIPIVKLYRDEIDRTIVGFASDKDEDKCAELDEGVMVEDVFNKFTNTRRCLAVPGLVGKIIAVEAIWDRGDPLQRAELEIPHRALFEEPIEPILPEDSLLWQFANELI